MQVCPVTGTPHKRFRFARRLMQALLRWTFIAIGALATASALFAHLYRVNESIYDPNLFAIGVGGLFCFLCSIMLIVLSRNSRLAMELKRAKIRCEALADSAWELKEAEARATSLLEAQGDLIVRRDSQGRITYVYGACSRRMSSAGPPRRKARPGSLQLGRAILPRSAAAKTRIRHYIAPPTRLPECVLCRDRQHRSPTRSSADGTRRVRAHYSCAAWSRCRRNCSGTPCDRRRRHDLAVTIVDVARIVLITQADDNACPRSRRRALPAMVRAHPRGLAQSPTRRRARLRQPGRRRARGFFRLRTSHRRGAQTAQRPGRRGQRDQRAAAAL